MRRTLPRRITLMSGSDLDPPEVPDLSRQARVLLTILAVSQALTIVAFIAATVMNLWGMFALHRLGGPTASMMLFALPVVLLSLVYAFLWLLLVVFGTLRFKKWALPLLLLAGFFISVNIVALAVSNPFDTAEQYLLFLVGGLVWLGSTVPMLTHRSSFVGSYRNLKFQLVFVLFAVPLHLVHSLGMLFPDPLEAGDDDLLQLVHSGEREALPEEENLYFSLERVRELAVTASSSSDLDPSWARRPHSEVLERWQEHITDGVRDQYAEMLDELLEASHKQRWSCPLGWRSTAWPFGGCFLPLFHDPPLVAVLVANLEAEQGDLEAALGRAFALFRVGETVLLGEGHNFVSYAQALMLTRSGLNAIERLMERHELSAELLLPVLEHLEAFEPSGVSDALVNEYAVFRGLASKIGQHHSRASHVYQKNRTIRLMADDARSVIGHGSLPCHEAAGQCGLWSDSDYYSPPPIWKLVGVNWLGVFFVSGPAAFNLGRNARNVGVAACYLQARVRSLALEMALAVHENETGETPVSQDRLVNRGLVKAPIINPVTNAPFGIPGETVETNMGCP